MAFDEDAETDVIAAEIERYLREQPNAADSLEGIRRWWLAPRIGERAAPMVQRALEHLHASGLIGREAVQGGAVIWGAALPRATRH